MLIGERRPRARAATRNARDERLIAAGEGPGHRHAAAYGCCWRRPRSRPDGGRRGAEPDGGDRTGPAAGPATAWASLLARIDAEEGLMPPDGAVMLNAVDMLKPAARAGPPADALRHGGARPRSTASSASRTGRSWTRRRVQAGAAGAPLGGAVAGAAAQAAHAPAASCSAGSRGDRAGVAGHAKETRCGSTCR